jgi:terminase large subunit-like protein
MSEASGMYDIGRGAAEGGGGGEPEAEFAGTAAEWARRQLGFEPDAAQTRVLNSTSKRVLLNCTRQWGKSTVTAAKAVHEAWTNPGSLTLVVSPSARQSGEFLRKAEGFVRRLNVKPRGDGDNEISMLLPNGSRMVGLPGREATVRGFSAVGLLLVDEASRVSDELYLSLRPMLAVSNGTLWLMSTPFGKSGFFWETWLAASRRAQGPRAGGALRAGGKEDAAPRAGSNSGWEIVRVPAEECPRIPKAFLEEERRTMGDLWFRQEYGCEFVDAVSGVFDSEAVERAVTDEVAPLEI